MKGHFDPRLKKRAIHRLKIIEGAVRGLRKLVESETYCVDVVTQSLGIQESLRGVNALVLENHLKTHVGKMMRGREEDRAIRELLRLYRLSKP